MVGSKVRALFRPSLGTVQNPENVDFLVHLVDDDKWQRREHELASAVDPSRTAAIRKATERSDAFNDALCYAAGRVRTGLGDVVADPFEVIGGVRGPTDAHQPR